MPSRASPSAAPAELESNPASSSGVRLVEAPIDRQARASRADRALRRWVAVERGIDRGLGRALRELKTHRRYRRLGFVCWADYVRERLGIEVRWAQELEKLDRACDKIPELGEALDGGMLVTSKVLDLFQVLGEETPASERQWWIERARRLTVRELRKEVKARKSEGRVALPESERPADPSETPAGAWIRIRTPARVAALWHRAVEHVRRLSNHDIPPFQCMEYMVADRFSAIGWPEDRLPEANPISTPTPPPSATASFPVDLEVGNPTQHAIRGGGERPGPMPETSAGGRKAPLYLDSTSVDDPWQLDRRVRSFEALKKRIRRRLGRFLLILSAADGAQALGFSTLEHYAEERLGMHPRRVKRLIKLHQALRDYPALAASYFAGQLSYLQVVLLLRVVHPRTAAAWAAWAAKRSFLTTERAVTYAELYAGPRTTSAHRTMFAHGTTSAPGTMSAHAGGEGVGHGELGDRTLPRGVALPPIGFRARPGIMGLTVPHHPDPTGESPPESELLQACIRFWCPAHLLSFIRAGLRSCRDPQGPPLPDWKCLEILLLEFLHQAADPNLRDLIDRFPALHRDGWRCTVLTCSKRTDLHQHHVWHRGQGGPDETWNLTTLCAGHHLEQEHGTGAIRVSGRAPDRLIWEIGRRPGGGNPLLRFHGEIKITDATHHTPSS